MPGRKVSPSRMTLLAFAIAIASAGLLDAAEEEAPKKENQASAENLAAWLTGRLGESLTLSETQAAEMVQVLVGEFTRLEEIFNEYRGRVDQDAVTSLQGDIRRLQKDTRAALKPVLSPEQLEVLYAYQIEHRGEIGGALIVYRLQKLLNLTAEQREQLVPVFAEDLIKRRELMQEAQDAESGASAMRSLRGKLKEIQSELDDRLEPVLSPEQLGAYRQYQIAMRRELEERMKRSREER